VQHDEVWRTWQSGYEADMSPAPLIGAVQARLAARSRWHLLEIAFWLAALSTYYLLPGKHLILTEIAILALFALSLDLILGYAGIISLGHSPNTRSSTSRCWRCWPRVSRPCCSVS
jgi:hypothetical protein